ncbi:MAG: carbohydrate-binding protein, partial [Spirochaetales bacterium]|nr:carbohydrate-binding protein [Spirochaetales bacterium]
LNSASQWIRVTLDSAGELTEICEANNTRTEKTNARAFRMGYHKERTPKKDHPEDFREVGVDENYRDKDINMVGSFSAFDWMYSHLERVNIMLQTTKSPTVSAVGIQEGLRLDDFYEWVYPGPFPHYYNELDANDFDGSYSDIRIEEENDDEFTYMYLYTGECHELGHNGLRLPDLYGTNYSVYNVFSGVTPGSAEFPIVTGNAYNQWDAQGILSSHESGNADAFNIGNNSFMTSCQLWLDPTLAGFLHYRRQDRYWADGSEFIWGEWTPHGEGKNRIQFLDYTGNPLTNAKVYVYPVIHFNWIGHINKYFPNQVKFAWTTDFYNGIFTFPTTTSNNWDDWTTTLVEGAESCFSPFDRHSGDDTPCYSLPVTKPNYREAESLLIKVVANDPASPAAAEMIEYHLLPLAELNSAFFAAGGDQNIAGTYTIRTSLADSSFLYVTMPDAPDTNNKPVAVLSGPTVPVTVNTSITLSAAGSHDGDIGRTDPLWYWWVFPNPSDPTDSDEDLSYQTYGTEDTFTAPSYSEPGNYTYKLLVFDGLKMSDVAYFNVKVVETHVEYQAEDGGWDNGAVESQHTGYTGTGYVNTVNEAGTSIYWTVNVPGPGSATLVFRYANGSTTNRYMTLEVQGNIIHGQMDFATTNTWIDWSETIVVAVPLVSGDNNIKIIANTGEGAPNMDRMDIYYTLY